MTTQVMEVKFTKEEVRDVYRKKAGIYDTWGRLTESRAREIGLSRIKIQNGEKILEVAVGTGLMFQEILIRNPDGINEGIDLTDAMLEKAKEKAAATGVRNYNLRTGDAYRLPFADESFDVLVNNYMFDLLPEKDFDSVLKEFRRVLKKDGRMLLINMTFGEKIYQRFFEFLARTGPRLMGICRGVALEGRLKENGFSQVERSFVSQMGFPSEILTANKN